MIVRLKMNTLTNEFRQTGIGGSDAGVVLGYSPWKTNIRLWEEKTGLAIPEDISEKPQVQRGNKMEAHLREIFAITHPFLTVGGPIDGRSEEYPWMFYTLDGTLTDTVGRAGVLEIKTAEVKNLKEWRDKIPQTYYCQVLHYLAATGFAFAYLYAYIQITLGSGEISGYLKEYRIERSDEDIALIIDREREFWRCVETKTKPNLIMRG
jgi:putative phage-type endonuclease